MPANKQSYAKGGGGQLKKNLSKSKLRERNKEIAEAKKLAGIRDIQAMINSGDIHPSKRLKALGFTAPEKGSQEKKSIRKQRRDLRIPTKKRK